MGGAAILQSGDGVSVTFFVHAAKVGRNWLIRLWRLRHNTGVQLAKTKAGPRFCEAALRAASRPGQAEIGIHHHIAGAYLLRYAQESSTGTSAITPRPDMLRTCKIDACDPFETLSRLAFLGSFVNIVRMTVVVITLANLWWRST